MGLPSTRSRGTVVKMRDERLNRACGTRQSAAAILGPFPTFFSKSFSWIHDAMTSASTSLNLVATLESLAKRKGLGKRIRKVQKRRFKAAKNQASKESYEIMIKSYQERIL